MQYSHENTFFNKNAGLQALSFIEKRLEHRCFFRTLRNFHLIRGSRPEVFRKKGVLISFTKFTGRYLRPATLLKKRLWRKCFAVNFAKFLRTPFFTEHLRWLLLPILKCICYTKETCLFMMFFIISFFSFSSLHVRWNLPYIIKDDTSEGFETA